MCFLYNCSYNLFMFEKQLNNIITEQEMDSLYQSYSCLFDEYISKNIHENFLKESMRIYSENRLMPLHKMIDYFASRGIKISKKHKPQWSQLVIHYERGFVNYGTKLFNEGKFELCKTKNETIEKLKLNYFEETPHLDGNGGFSLVTESYRKNYQSPLHFAWQILIYHRSIDNPIEINEVLYFTTYHLIDSNSTTIRKNPSKDYSKFDKRKIYNLLCIQRL